MVVLDEDYKFVLSFINNIVKPNIKEAICKGKYYIKVPVAKYSLSNNQNKLLHNLLIENRYKVNDFSYCDMINDPELIIEVSWE